jgi:photosystem II stability/assembly factor-like uncharacterized protein
MTTRRSTALVIALAIAAPAGAGSWSGQVLTTDNLRVVVFAPGSETIGWTGGSNGAIFKTTDGTNWVAKTSSTTNRIRSMWFPEGDQIGYACASNTDVGKTTDGGDSWTWTSLRPGAENVNDIHFVDNNTGWAAMSAAEIYWTTDGGDNWNLATDPGTADDVDTIWFINATTGFAAGGAGVVMKSTDGGDNWTGQTLNGAISFLGIHFPTNTTGYLVGENGVMYKTTDAGQNWNPLTSGTGENLNAVWFTSEDIGYVVGDAGLLMRTTDGGSTWVPQNSGTNVNLQSIHFPIDETTGWASGYDGAMQSTSDSTGSGLILHPNADVTPNGFTVSGCANHWDCVNDQTIDIDKGTVEPSDGSTTYLEGTASAREMFGLIDGQVPGGATVTALEIQAYVGKQGGGAARYARLSYDIGGGYQDGSQFEVTGSTQLNQLATASWTGLTLTPTDIDNLEIGILHDGGNPIRVTQMYVIVTYDLPAGTVVNYRSIGTDGGILYQTGTASITNGSSTVDFSGAWLPVDIGQGDKLTIGLDVFHILSRNSTSQVTVQETASSTHTNQSYTIERAYTTLQGWEDDRDGNLVGDSRREVGICYDDGWFTDRLVIGDSTTDASHYMHLTVAPIARHNGRTGSGVGIDAEGGWAGQNAIDVQDENTRIEYLEIMDSHDANGIVFHDSPAADNGLVNGVLIHSFWQNSNAAVWVEADNVTVRNSMMTGGTTYAVHVDANASATIENCTAYGFAGGGHGFYGAANSTIGIKNSISVNHGTLDIYIETTGGATITYFGYNMFLSTGGGFDPNGYEGNNQSPPVDLDDLFRKPASDDDLRLERAGHNALDNGVDLTATFTGDFNGNTRPLDGGWDMGADEAAFVSPRINRWAEVRPY